MASITAGGSSTLTVNVGATVAAGTYTVTITGTEGTAVHSTTVSVTVTAVPGAPTLTANRSSRRGVQLNWTIPASNGSPITAYRIYRSTTSSAEIFLIQVGTGSTSYGDSSTASGVTYFYKITAVNGIGEGRFTNEASARAR